MHAKMAATLMRALVFFIISINVLAFKDRLNALNGNLTCYAVLSSTIDLKGVWFTRILEAWLI